MNEHVGCVLQYDPGRHEARVRLGGVACRVCGGRGCALKDRVVRVAIPPDRPVAQGDLVQIAGSKRAMFRAVFRLLVAPAGVALGVYGGLTALDSVVRQIVPFSGSIFVVRSGPVVTGPAVIGAAAGALLVLGIVILRGSRRRDLPVLVATLSSGDRFDQG